MTAAPADVVTPTAPVDGKIDAALPLPAEEDQPDGSILLYDLWQGALSSTLLAHGRADVIDHADLIHAYAPDDLEMVVAAAIAHQASDFKDRPFGTDTIEVIVRDHIKDDASVGIAQLRPWEITEWAPRLVGRDLMEPDVAIRVMTAKLQYADRYITTVYGDIPVTDRIMLLALVQNTSRYQAMRQTIDTFFWTAGRDWSAMFLSETGRRQDWLEQSRLILLHVDWLIDQGWPAPPGLDVDYWRRVAFPH